MSVSLPLNLPMPILIQFLIHLNYSNLQICINTTLVYTCIKILTIFLLTCSNVHILRGLDVGTYYVQTRQRLTLTSDQSINVQALSNRNNTPETLKIPPLLFLSRKTIRITCFLLTMNKSPVKYCVLDCAYYQKILHYVVY